MDEYETLLAVYLRGLSQERLSQLDSALEVEFKRRLNEPPAAPVKRSTSGVLGQKDLVDEGVDQKLAKDWLAVRRAKKAVLTPTAWAAIKREAESAGLSLSEAIRISTENGWQGFKASWLQKAAPGRHGQDDIFAGAR